MCYHCSIVGLFQLSQLILQIYGQHNLDPYGQFWLRMGQQEHWRQLEHQRATMGMLESSHQEKCVKPRGAHYNTEHNNAPVPTIPFSARIISGARDYVDCKLGEAIEIVEISTQSTVIMYGNSSPRLEKDCHHSAHMRRTQNAPA